MFFVSGLSIAENWNAAAKKLLEHPELEWMFLMNDDHVYQPDVLLRLLAHDVDAVTGLYVDRVFPFQPVLFGKVADAAGHVTRLSWPTEETAPDLGLHKIVACGDGALLVRRSVFELIDAPWWTFGAVDPDRADHDLAFCAKLREHGVQIYADMNTVVDHVTPVALRPTRQPDGSWTVQIRDRQGAYVDVGVVEEEGSVQSTEEEVLA